MFVNRMGLRYLNGIPNVRFAKLIELVQMSGSFRRVAVVGGPAEDISVVATAALPATSSSSYTSSSFSSSSFFSSSFFSSSFSSSSSSSSSFSSPLHRRLSAHNFSCCCAAGALSAAAWPRFESRLVFGLLHDGAAPQAPQNTCLFCLASPKPSL